MIVGFENRQPGVKDTHRRSGSVRESLDASGFDSKLHEQRYFTALQKFHHRLFLDHPRTFAPLGGLLLPLHHHFRQSRGAISFVDHSRRGDLAILFKRAQRIRELLNGQQEHDSTNLLSKRGVCGFKSTGTIDCDVHEPLCSRTVSHVP